MDTAELSINGFDTRERDDFNAISSGFNKTKRPREYFHLWAESSVHAEERSPANENQGLKQFDSAEPPGRS
jgi:hypothetical protein